jgi:hypothetical protein
LNLHVLVDARSELQNYNFQNNGLADRQLFLAQMLDESTLIDRAYDNFILSLTYPLYNQVIENFKQRGRDIILNVLTSDNFKTIITLINSSFTLVEETNKEWSRIAKRLARLRIGVNPDHIKVPFITPKFQYRNDLTRDNIARNRYTDNFRFHHLGSYRYNYYDDELEGEEYLPRHSGGYRSGYQNGWRSDSSSSSDEYHGPRNEPARDPNPSSSSDDDIPPKLRTRNESVRVRRVDPPRECPGSLYGPPRDRPRPDPRPGPRPDSRPGSISRFFGNNNRENIRGFPPMA